MRAAKCVLTAVLSMVVVGQSESAYAIFGEEEWLGGQNELLVELIVDQLKQIGQLVELVNNARMILGSVNDALALARTVKRVYDIVRNYNLDKLVADAKRGLYKAMPELRQTEADVRELIDNGQALSKGEGAFFSKVTIHDAQMSAAARKSFEHGYQATIWPAVFPDAMDFLPDPSPVELLIQQRYLRTNDERRRAVQRTALGVLEQKVQAFVDDAEEKDNAELRSLATDTQVNFQSMANLTELKNLKEQESAEKEAARIDDQTVRTSVGKALGDNAGILVGGPGGRQ
jgi:hypothetical protein